MKRSALETADLGPYLLADRIGQGGMATVYKASRQGDNLQRTVVVKRMLPEHAHKPDLVEMFRTEARLLALLNHSNIVQFLEFGLMDGVPYIVMEYLDGHDVAQILNNVGRGGKRLPIEATVSIAREMCRGLGWAHAFVAPGGLRHQIIHRDVSPANVMVCRDGTVKLLDFGIAKITREYSRDVTALKGKFGYMAPEQVRNRPIDRRVDVFSAGVVLHEMLTGKRLFPCNTWLETLREISNARVQPPSLVNPEVPPELDAIVLRALALDPEARYASAAEMGEALEALPVRGYSSEQLAEFLSDLNPEDRSSEAEWAEHTLVELDDSEIEIIHSIRSMQALALQEEEQEEPRAEPAPHRSRRSRAITIGLSAMGGAALAALVSLAMGRPAHPPLVHSLSAPAVVTAATPTLLMTPSSAADLAAAPRPAAPSSRTHALPMAPARPHRTEIPAELVPLATTTIAPAAPVLAMSSTETEATPPDSTDDPLAELDELLSEGDHAAR